MGQHLGSIERLRALWHDETGPAARRAVWAALAAGVIGAALVGRLGEPWSRAAAAGLALLGALPLVLRGMVLRRRARDPRAVMEATLLKTQPDLARAALRALNLTQDTATDPQRGSAELAQYHFRRLLGRASLSDLVESAGRRAWFATAVALLVSIATLATVLRDPFKVLEGFDVLAARDGVAPVPMRWVELPRYLIEPPAYLQEAGGPIRPYHPAALPMGTVITVSVAPLHADRALVLTDGRSEVPFVDDAEGDRVAHWTVDGDAELRIAARFGDVVVPEPLGLSVDAIADHSPHVRLEGAPRTLRLLDEPKIPLHWRATDDHGLREVALVLRAGEREERRRLSEPNGGTVVDKGGIELRADDPFLEKSYLPIEVTVEALDNDPISGPKWGRSQSLVLLPPQIGEREAMRLAALTEGRDAVTDLLALRLENGEAPKDARAVGEREKAAQLAAMATLRRALDGEWGGLELRGRLAVLAEGQIELLDRGLAAWLRAPTRGTRKELIQRTERVVLALDSAVGALGQRDVRAACRELSEVAADAALAIQQTRESESHDRARRRLEADLGVLDRSAPHLIRMGSLGRDLGEIVENGLRRIHRAWEVDDRYHAHLAAIDLAARLARPDPSFGAAGGSGGGGGGQHGVESGGGQSPSEGESSQAAEQAADLEQALEALRQEHAREIEEVERALQDAMSPEMRQALEEQMREAAKQVREAVKDLPRQATDPSTARAKAAQGKSEAEAAASAMERGDHKAAMEQGKKALEALEKAAQQGQQAPAGSPERDIGEEAADAAQQLRNILQGAQKGLEGAQKSASEGAKEGLSRAAARERDLAKRAGRLREDSAASEAPLPGSMQRRLEEAARAMERAGGELERGDGESALDKQREAQRLLEMAQPEREDEPSPKDRHGDGNEFARDADVPPEARDERADAFRRRVTEGLGKDAPPHLREALKRYTEGLLR